MRLVTYVLIAAPLLTLAETTAATAEANPRLIAQVVSLSGKSTSEKLNDVDGHLLAPTGSSVRLSIDPDCADCQSAKVVSATNAGTAIASYKDRQLPVSFVGGGLPLAIPGNVVVRIEITKKDGTKSPGDYTIRYDLLQDENWWLVADTVAYAVTRQQGNTAIAGAGAFFDFPHWSFLNKTRGVLRWSVVVHLLPPAAKDEPADIGIAPLGISLFGNRIVAGVGWNISRQGLRPNENNRYVYVGFSASQILKAK